MKKELVISVFDKDLSWLDKVSKEVSIKKYRKGSNLNLDGEIYLSNWPILMTKEGNYKCYIKTKFQYAKVLYNI